MLTSEVKCDKNSDDIDVIVLEFCSNLIILWNWSLATLNLTMCDKTNLRSAAHVQNLPND